MTKTRNLVLLAAAGAALALPAAAQGAGSPTLTPAAGAKFPERSFVLTLPERARLDRSAVVVTENGSPVRKVRVAPVGAGRKARVGVVLALDTSSSMRGRPLAEAYRAARAFARARDERQPLGLVEFNTASDLRMDFTTDRSAIRRTLARSGGARGGTHLYDAAMRSIEAVRASGLPGGFVVLLSDGADRGSSADLDSVAQAARAAHVRLFNIGLRSKHYDAGALKRLAEATGGGYAEASSAGRLEGIFRALGAQLSNGHLLRYESLAPARTRVGVEVAVTGFGTAATSYTAPRLVARTGSAGEPGWSASSGAPVVVALVVALLLGLAVAALLFRWRQTPRERIAQFVHAPDDDSRTSIAGRVVSETEKSLSGSGWWPSFTRQLDIGGSKYSGAQVVAGSAAAAIGLAILAAAASGRVILAPLVLAVAPFVVRSVVRSRAQRERRRFAEQLADHLAVVGGAMRAGHGLPAALSSVLDEAPEPARREFARAIADERLGAPLEDSLQGLAERMQNRDVEQVALLARLQREAGANAAEMLDRVVDTIRERQALRRSVRTLTAQGRMSRWILTGLPVVVLAGLTLTNKTYVEPLFNTGIGRFLMLVSLLMLVAGSLLIKRIVNFEI